MQKSYFDLFLSLQNTDVNTETITKKLPVGKGRPARKADKPHRHL
jgi:hypothetical protein